MMEIIPAILASSKEQFTREVEAMKGLANLVHIDIMDGSFVPQTSWADPDIAKTLLSMDCELHLMVNNPLEHAKRWHNVPQVKRLIPHIETIHSREAFSDLQSIGHPILLAINPETDPALILPYMTMNTGVMCMAVHPGKQGQTFIPETLERIQQFRADYPKHRIAVDGGVNAHVVSSIVNAGADAACVGSAIFGSQHPAQQLRNIRQLTAK